MTLDPRLLEQVLRAPRHIDVGESPVVTAIILRDPENAEVLVPFLDDPDSTSAIHAQQILSLFDCSAVPSLMRALGDSRRSAGGRTEGLTSLWSMLVGEDASHASSILREVASDLHALFEDRRLLPDRLPDFVDDDFYGRVCDLTYIVLRHATDRDFDSSRFRLLEDDDRNQEIARFERRLFGGSA